MCHILTSPLLLRQTCLSYMKSYKHNTKAFVIAEHLYLSFLGIWNLDFFRLLYRPFCLHPNSSTLQVLSLDYSLPSCPHHPHLHTSQTPLPQLHTCGVAVEALHQLLCSLSKAVGHSELTAVFLSSLQGTHLQPSGYISLNMHNYNTSDTLRVQPIQK